MPIRMSRPGQKSPRFLIASRPAADYQPDPERDEDDRPDDLEPEPPQEVQVVEQKVDPNQDQDCRPEILLAPGHGGPILEAPPVWGGSRLRRARRPRRGPAALCGRPRSTRRRPPWPAPIAHRRGTARPPASGPRR